MVATKERGAVERNLRGPQGAHCIRRYSEVNVHIPPNAKHDMPAPASAHSIIDQEALARLRRFGGDKLLGDMIELFAQHGPERVVAARAGFETADSVVVKAALHALKSSAGQLGALAVQELCAAGEMRAAKGDLSEMSLILVRLEEEVQRALAALASDRKPAP